MLLDIKNAYLLILNRAKRFSVSLDNTHKLEKDIEDLL